VSDNGKHGNAAVLDFNFTQTIEPGLVGTLGKSKRIPVIM